MHAALLAEESLLVLELHGLLDDVDRPFPSQPPPKRAAFWTKQNLNIFYIYLKTKSDIYPCYQLNLRIVVCHNICSVLK